MAFGDSPHDESLRTAWRQFCARLQDAGERAFKDYNPATPLQRTDALRFLTQNLGQAFDLALETKDTRYPALHYFCAPNRKLGGDNADFVYIQAWIDGDSVYKISGNRGTARFINFTVQGQRPEKMPGTDFPSLQEPFGDIPEANLFGHELQTAWDGSFELYIGGPKRSPNWLPTTPGSRKLFLRQGFDNWNELPARMSIERIDMNTPRPVPTPDVMLNSIDWAGRFITGVMNDWPDHPYQYVKSVDPINVNRFPQEAPEDAASDKRRGRAIQNMCWQLAADEALIAEFEHHADHFWMTTNMGSFMNSMDYLYRPVSHTPSRTRVDTDGKIRLILSHEDPGYYNWVDTQGFTRGNLCFRSIMRDDLTIIRTRLVKRDQLKGALPADTAMVSADERVNQMRARFNAIRQRYSQ